MSENTDWLHSHTDVCKVDLYSPKVEKEQDRKVICFIDVSTLNMEGKDSENDGGSSSRGNIILEKLKEKEIIVIKDTEKQDSSKMEGSVCLLKQTPSDPLSALNCLLDLQRYALGFQHVLNPTASICKYEVGETEGKHHKLTSGNCCSVYANQLNMDYMASGPQRQLVDMTAPQNNNNQSPSLNLAKSPNAQRREISSEGEHLTDGLSSSINQLSSLAIQMVRKKVKKLEDGSKCFHHLMHPISADKGKNSPRNAAGKPASEMAHDGVKITSAEMRVTEEECQEGGQKMLLHSELIHKNKKADRQMCQRDSKEFLDSISKGLMVYGNQIASDMMLSVMKTLKVHTSEKPIPACVVLKKVLLKHTKEIVSNLTDSCLRNLQYNSTKDLLSDPDFASAVKRNGKQNAANIMNAMLKRLVTTLLGEKRERKSQSLSYASWKAESHDPKCKNQSLKFSNVKAEMKKEDKNKIKPDKCKSLSNAEKVGEHILKENLTTWNQTQRNQGKIAGKACTSKEEKREKISPSTDSLAKDLIASALMLIQYHLTQQAKDKEAFEEDHRASTMNFMTQSAQYEKSGCGQSAKALSMKQLESHGTPGPSTSRRETQQADSQKLDMSNIVLSLIQKLLNGDSFNCDELSEGKNKRSEPRSKKATSISKRGEEQCHENQEVDFISGLKQMSRQFIDLLVESVLKLCLIMAEYNNNGEALADLEEQAALANNPNYQAAGPRSSHDGAMSQNYQDPPGLEVIVSNQCSTSQLQKQLQAVLQWITASQFNMPMLYFMGDDDGQLEKLPEVSAKAVEKGYSVGDLLQEVIKFAKERQLDEALGNVAKQLLDWLLANL